MQPVQVCKNWPRQDLYEFDFEYVLEDFDLMILPVTVFGLETGVKFDAFAWGDGYRDRIQVPLDSLIGQLHFGR